MTESTADTTTYSDPDPAPTGYQLTYIYGPEAWYRRNVGVGESILIALVPADRRGCRWEFKIFCDRIGAGSSVRFEMYGDAFAAYIEAPELFAALADETPRTLEAVRLVLDRLGVVDDTPRTGPNGETDIPAAIPTPYQALKAAVRRVRARIYRAFTPAPDWRDSDHTARLADTAADTYDVLVDIRDDLRAIRDALDSDQTAAEVGKLRDVVELIAVRTEGTDRLID